MATQTGTVLCPFCASTGNVVPISGPVITPTGAYSINFDTINGDFAGIEAQILHHKQTDGRPTILHNCPVAGHQVLLYPDSPGGSVT